MKADYIICYDMMPDEAGASITLAMAVSHISYTVCSEKHFINLVTHLALSY